jgi:hypothetical protein
VKRTLLAALALLACNAVAQTSVGPAPSASVVIHAGIWAAATDDHRVALRVVDNVTGWDKMQIRADGSIRLYDDALVDFSGVRHRWTLRQPVSAGYIRVKHNGVTVYIPSYFDLQDDPE